MSENRDARAARLREARSDAGYESPTEAAKAMGVAAVSTYLGHENGSRGFGSEASRYADFFKVNIEWLLTGRGLKKKSVAQSNVESSIDKNGHKVPDLTTPEFNLRHLAVDLPILGSGACGGDGVFEMNGQVLGLTKRPPKLVGVTGAYALYVNGDSMEPWRFRGRMVLVHPHQPPQIGDFVVVQLHAEDGSENKPAFIKRLVRRTAKDLRLAQYNPPEEMTFPMRKVASIHRIIEFEEAMGY